MMRGVQFFFRLSYRKDAAHTDDAEHADHAEQDDPWAECTDGAALLQYPLYRVDLARSLLPDMPDGLTGFQMAEMCISILFEPEADNLGCKMPLCCNPRCALPALAGVAWFPFDVANWDGKTAPVCYLNDDPTLAPPPILSRHNAPPKERRTVGIPVYGWCGTGRECKDEMMAFITGRFTPMAIQKGMTGGRPYCYICGSMQEDHTTDDCPEKVEFGQMCSRVLHEKIKTMSAL
jgi:hypothetical protein